MNCEQRLAGRVALVTGATSGLGRATALRFAREGAAVMCTDVRAKPDPEVGDDPGPPVLDVIEAEQLSGHYLHCDVTSGSEVAGAMQKTVDTFGGLDIVVANAGVDLDAGFLTDDSIEDYERTVNVNQTGVWRTCREAARQMTALERGGRIIVIASIAALVGVRANVAYAASKGAALQIARTLAAQLAPRGITVNAICPGSAMTAISNWARDPEVLAQSLSQYPLGRLGRPDDIAGAAYFLASDDAAWITGVALPVDGGYTCV